ncbi:MAG: hypothetical protein ACOCUD_01685 [Bacillota bacterium]
MKSITEKIKENKKNKKGSIQTVFFAIVTLFGLAIFIIVMAHIIPQVTEGLRESDLNNSAAARAALGEADDNVGQLDYIYLMVFAGLLMGSMVFSFMIDSHPIFIPIFIFLMGFAVVIGAIMDNVYEEFEINSALNETAAEQNYVSGIMGNFVMVTLGFAILNLIIIFAKIKLGSNGI